MEESSRLVLKLPLELTDEFKSIEYNSQLAEALYELAEYTGLDTSYIDQSEARYSQIICVNGYIQIADDTGIWSDLSEAFVQFSSGIEYYAIHTNAYGIHQFLSLNSARERHHIVYDAEDDELIEGCKEKFVENLKEWRSSLPEALIVAFPDFAIYSVA